MPARGCKRCPGRPCGQRWQRLVGGGSGGSNGDQWQESCMEMFRGTPAVMGDATSHHQIPGLHSIILCPTPGRCRGRGRDRLPCLSLGHKHGSLSACCICRVAGCGGAEHVTRGACLQLHCNAARAAARRQPVIASRPPPPGAACMAPRPQRSFPVGHKVGAQRIVAHAQPHDGRAA